MLTRSTGLSLLQLDSSGTPRLGHPLECGKCCKIRRREGLLIETLSSSCASACP